MFDSLYRLGPMKKIQLNSADNSKGAALSGRPPGTDEYDLLKSQMSVDELVERLDRLVAGYETTAAA